MSTHQVNRDPCGMQPSGAHASGPKPMGADAMMGKGVYNQDGEDLGDIKQFMIAMASRQIGFAALSISAQLGRGAKQLAAPGHALPLDTVKHRCTLNLPNAKLKIAPGLDKSRGPSMADKAWASGVHSPYGLPRDAG